ncbi:Protein of unknown function [Lachnospiraceae bacterium KHCPX20]|nr:Protein of unknown function [Lachnospiraceae bacterium KHCPX20]
MTTSTSEEQRKRLKKLYIMQKRNAGISKADSQADADQIDTLSKNQLELLQHILLNTNIILDRVLDLQQYQLRDGNLYYTTDPFYDCKVPKKSKTLFRPSKMRSLLLFLQIISFATFFIFLFVFLRLNAFESIASGNYRLGFTIAYFLMTLSLEKLLLVLTGKLKDHYFFSDMKPYNAVIAGAKLQSSKSRTYTLMDIMQLPDGSLINIESENDYSTARIREFFSQRPATTRIWVNTDTYDRFLTDEEYRKKNGSRLFARILSYGSTLIFLLSILSMGYIYNGFHMDQNPYARQVLIHYTDSDKKLISEYPESDSPYSFGCNITSLYADLENGDKYTLGGHPIAEDDSSAISDAKNFLRNTWNIDARNSSKHATGATDVIDSLIRYGANSSYRLFVQKHPEIKVAAKEVLHRYGKDFSVKDVIVDRVEDYKAFRHTTFHSDEARYLGATYAYARHGSNALAAYDFMRLYRIAGICNRVGFISDRECLTLCYNMAQVLQKNYTSFEDIHEMYCYGEMFRLKKDTPKNRSQIQRDVTSIKHLEKNGDYTFMNLDFDQKLNKHH